MPVCRSASVVAAVVLLSSTAWGVTAVPLLRSANLSDSELILLTSFLASSYEKFSGERVTMDIVDAEEVIEGLASGLGPDGSVPILVRVLRRTGLGAVIAQAELRIERRADAPAVFERLAEALVRKQPPSAPRMVPGVLRLERGPETKTLLGVKLWFVLPLALGRTFNGLGVVMFDARFEKETHFFELGAGFVIPGPSASATSQRYGGFVAELGASRYLTGGTTALYAGGGLLPRLLFSPGIADSPLNLAPYGQLGLMVDRASSLRLYADLRVAQNVLPIRVASVSGSPQGAYPTELSGQIGIGW